MTLEQTRPTIIPDGFQSLLTEAQKQSPRYLELMADSGLTEDQQKNSVWLNAEMIGAEQEVIDLDPNATPQQKETSAKRYYEARNALLKMLQ